MSKKLNLLTIHDFKHYRDGKVIWQKDGILNTWHLEGQAFVLANSFDLDYGVAVPTNYYFGLDNRQTVNEDDTMASIDGEPSTNGYTRQSVNSTTGFVIRTTTTVEATSAIVAFTATTGNWGPIRNIFLTTEPDNDGFLISTADLATEQTITAGDSVTFRCNLSLGGC